MTGRNPIGGYFGLELPYTGEWHSGAVALNSGRCCLEYILRCRKCASILVPYFICGSVLETVRKLGVPYRFYHIRKDYRIDGDVELVDGEMLLYVNYWGMQSGYCMELSRKYGKRLILDYTQAFFACPIDGIDTFYSCRKFFGVPDGGYLYTDAVADFEIRQDVSWTRMDSLTKRIDLSPEDGYDDFRRCNGLFRSMPVGYMSRLTRRMMQGIDYRKVADRRRANYRFLLEAFGGNRLRGEDVPMVFPLEVSDGQKLREHLIRNRIFVARYWSEVQLREGISPVEYSMVDNLLYLPVDQRYDIGQMDVIIKTINGYYG